MFRRFDTLQCFACLRCYFYLFLSKIWQIGILWSKFFEWKNKSLILETRCVVICEESNLGRGFSFPDFEQWIFAFVSSRVQYQFARKKCARFAHAYWKKICPFVFSPSLICVRKQHPQKRPLVRDSKLTWQDWVSILVFVKVKKKVGPVAFPVWLVELWIMLTNCLLFLWCVCLYLPISERGEKNGIWGLYARLVETCLTLITQTWLLIIGLRRGSVFLFGSSDIPRREFGISIHSR